MLEFFCHIFQKFLTLHEVFELESLEDVVEYYDKGGEKNKFLDPAIFPLKLTEQEKKDLVEFMKSLTSPQYQKSK